MPLLSLLTALLAAAAQLQISFGQHINDGVASHKLTPLLQSQLQNATDAGLAADSEQNKIVANNWDQNQYNNSATFHNGATITNIKFVRNPAYDGPAPSFSVMNNKGPISGGNSRDAVPVNLQSALLNGMAPNAVGQTSSTQSEDRAEPNSKSPVFISFAPRFAGVVPSQTPYCISASPTQSTSSNMTPLQSSFSAPPQKQQSYQTFSSVQYQPLNIQNPSNMRFRFLPTSATGSMQSTVPIQSTVPTCNTAPIQNTLPMQKIADNPIQNPHLSLLLSHLFSCPVRQEHSSSSIRYPSQEQKPSKLTVVKTLLPLLLELLAEKDSNFCEYKNERPRTNTKYKQGFKQLYKTDANSLQHGILSRTADHRHRVSQSKVLRPPYDESVENEDYSDESSDYTAEDYDDEN